MKVDNIQRMTDQRRVILDELRSTKSHPTADELYRTVRKRLPRISLGTVYRNLDILTKAGLIQKLDFGAGQSRYDADLSDHYHLRCVDCNRIVDVMGLPRLEYDNNILSESAFEIIGHSLEFLGICPDCRSKQGGLIDMPD
ncbi:MAG: transcriptional repressor [Candidatus Zixiibacteriota bacterium]